MSGRKIVHVSMLAFALLLAFISRQEALACAAAAFAFNLFVYPRIANSTMTDEERRVGYSLGILLYPISVFLLILLFPPYIAAGAWAVMALGDGLASVAGARWSFYTLPWNHSKTYAGSFAFLMFGFVGCLLLMTWTIHFSGRTIGRESLLLMAFSAALVAAIVESLPCLLNDNLSVPLCAGATLWIVSKIHPSALHIRPDLLFGIALSTAVGIAALKLRSVNAWGAAGGILLGICVYAGLGPTGFFLLLAFFALSSAITRAGYDVKVFRGVAEERQGARGLGSVSANGLVAAACAFLAAGLRGTHLETIAAAAFVGAIAAAAADTASSEIGQWLGRRYVLITTFRTETVGVNGAISLTGTAAGVIAAFAIGLTAFAMRVIPAHGVAVIALAGTAGTIADSFLGALFENRGLLGNHEVNFFCTLVGASIAGLMI